MIHAHGDNRRTIRQQGAVSRWVGEPAPGPTPSPVTAVVTRWISHQATRLEGRLLTGAGRRTNPLRGNGDLPAVVSRRTFEQIRHGGRSTPASWRRPNSKKTQTPRAADLKRASFGSHNLE